MTMSSSTWMFLERACKGTGTRGPPSPGRARRARIRAPCGRPSRSVQKPEKGASTLGHSGMQGCRGCCLGGRKGLSRPFTVGPGLGRGKPHQLLFWEAGSTLKDSGSECGYVWVGTLVARVKPPPPPLCSWALPLGLGLLLLRGEGSQSSKEGAVRVSFWPGPGRNSTARRAVMPGVE